MQAKQERHASIKEELLLELVLLAIAIDGDALLGLWDSGF